MAFWKKNKKEKENKKPNPRNGSIHGQSSNATPEEFKRVGAETGDESASQSARETDGHVDISKFRNFEYGVLKGFYVSEKATILNSFNQYVFKVFDDATKNEVKKQVEKGFEVKVKGVKIVNLPRKKRNVGRHSGFKKGLKKAIVVLEKEYSIDSAKA